MTDWLILTVSQGWHGKTYSAAHTIYVGKRTGYPIWETARMMDMRLYTDSGVILPSREWAARPLRFGDDNE